MRRLEVTFSCNFTRSLPEPKAKKLVGLLEVFFESIAKIMPLPAIEIAIEDVGECSEDELEPEEDEKGDTKI